MTASSRLARRSARPGDKSAASGTGGLFKAKPWAGLVNFIRASRSEPAHALDNGLSRRDSLPRREVGAAYSRKSASSRSSRRSREGHSRSPGTYLAGGEPAGRLLAHRIGRQGERAAGGKNVELGPAALLQLVGLVECPGNAAPSGEHAVAGDEPVVGRTAIRPRQYRTRASSGTP